MNVIELPNRTPVFKFDLSELKKTHKNPFFNNNKGEWVNYSIEEIVDILQNAKIKILQVVGEISEVEVIGFKPGFDQKNEIIGQRLFVYNQYLQ
jgi:hypothetical protein